MCQTPNLLPNGSLVACRNCRLCSENRINDWVGRCVAESRTAAASTVVTFTYGGGDHERAAVLTYSDMQKCFKQFRKRGYPLKYFAIGEYGSTKGRTHWHVIIYWRDKPYPHINRYGVPMGFMHDDKPTERLPSGPWNGKGRFCKAPHSDKEGWRYFDDVWPHGHMVWDTADAAAVRYACKYLQKDTGEADKQYHLAMSKKPPLGSEYFAQLAQEWVDARLSPQDLFYDFDECRKRNGERKKFFMTGATARDFCKAYLKLWKEQVGGWYPPSDMLQAFEDSQLGDRPIEFDFWWKIPDYPPLPHPAPVRFDAVYETWRCDLEDVRLFWSVNEEGKGKWQDAAGIEETRYAKRYQTPQRGLSENPYHLRGLGPLEE